MADKFLATFNIVKGSSEDYAEILNAVKRKHESGDIKHYVRLGSLSTTYNDYMSTFCYKFRKCLR